MKINKFAALTMAAAIAAAPSANITAAAAGKDIFPETVLSDFNVNDVNGRLRVTVPEEVTAYINVTFDSPEGKDIPYYQLTTSESGRYCFELEGHEDNEDDYRHYNLYISFRGDYSQAKMPPYSAKIDIEDKDFEPGSYAVYDYVFVTTDEKGKSFYGNAAGTAADDIECDVYDCKTIIARVNHVIKGDVNGDGRVTVVDASAALQECGRLANNASTFTEEKKIAADVNEDSRLTNVDATKILKYCSELAKGGKPAWKI